MHAISECDSVSSFSHISKMKTLQILKKIDELTDMIEFGEFFSLSLEIPSVTSNPCVCYLDEENKSVASVSELRYKMFTEKNFSGDRSPSTSDALALYLRRALIFFINV